MRRRVFLASAGIAALAGCSSGTESTGETATATPTPTSTETGEPNFELRNVRIPDTQTLNVPTSFVIAIENTGSGDGTFTSELDMRVDDGEWRTGGELELDVAAGETVEWRSPGFTPQYLSTLHFRLSEFEETWSLEITPRELDFGNYYDVPNGLRINVLGGSFESAYPTSDNSTSTPTQAPDGETWTIISLDVRNRRQEALTTPPASSFDLVIDGEARPQQQDVAENPYEGGELSGRTVQRGELVYAVPEGTEVGDISVVWEGSLPDGDVKSIWTE